MVSVVTLGQSHPVRDRSDRESRTIVNKLRGNLFFKFSLTAFVVMLLLGGAIALLVSQSLGEILGLLNAHAVAMGTGTPEAGGPEAIAGIYSAVEQLRDETLLIFSVGTFLLYSGLVVVVHQGWRTIEKQRQALQDSNERLRSIDEERQRLLEAERKNRDLADSLRRVGLALSATLNLQELLDHICRESMHLFDVDATYLWLVRNGNLVGFAGFGDDREAFLDLKVRLDDQETLGPRVIREKRPIYVNDCAHSDQVNQTLIQRFHVMSILGVPLMTKGRAIGALMVIDSHASDRFSETEAELGRVLASHAAVAIDNAQLFVNLERSKERLERAYDSTLEGWSRALELRDHETEGHTKRVAAMSVHLARELGLSESDLVHVRRGALLHDIGKMAIPDRILRKPGPLTEAEWEIMRKHPVYARDLLEPIDYLRPAIDIPYSHHEKWDGSGYPLGLSREEIPLSARIFAVIDVYDALTCDRPYRDAWPEDDVLAHIDDQTGMHFDPHVAEAFFELMPELASPIVLDDAPPSPGRKAKLHELEAALKLGPSPAAQVVSSGTTNRLR